jgi:hypothetical protein
MMMMLPENHPTLRALQCNSTPVYRPPSKTKTPPPWSPSHTKTPQPCLSSLLHTLFLTLPKRPHPFLFPSFSFSLSFPFSTNLPQSPNSCVACFLHQPKHVIKSTQPSTLKTPAASNSPAQQLTPRDSTDACRTRGMLSKCTTRSQPGRLNG